MKLIVNGGTGLIGTKVVNGLREKGHEVVAASPSQGINSVTGEGLAKIACSRAATSARRSPRKNLIKASSIPYTIVRATQFFEFVGGIAQSATEGQTVGLPAAMMQPIASDDVAATHFDDWLNTSAQK